MNPHYTCHREESKHMRKAEQTEKIAKNSRGGSQAARERMFERHNLSKKELTPQEAREKMLQRRGGGGI